tara:strand:- start:1305 stop:2393 length:1089 start_codon:yes stop_codon:yes gene_type:complete
MDVGADNFRFDLDTKNGLKKDAQTSRYPATAELHIDSLDRYLPNMLTPNTLLAPFNTDTLVAKLAGPIYLPTSLNGVDVNINNGRSLINGYFGRVALTQFMLKRNIPTVRTGVNDVLTIVIASSAAGPVIATANITLDEGYYTINELAIDLQNKIQAVGGPFVQAFVLAPFAVGNNRGSGFLFGTGNPANFMAISLPPGLTRQQTLQRLRCFRLLGIDRELLGFPNVNLSPALATPTYYLQGAGAAPNLLGTDYVDIVSSDLTNYKDAKDANSSLGSPGAVLARVWMVESTINNSNDPADLLNMGSRPFTIIKTWTNPNWCQWSPNQTLNTLDIRLIDMFGNGLFWTNGAPTEWSGTLTFTE